MTLLRIEGGGGKQVLLKHLLFFEGGGIFLVEFRECGNDWNVKIVHKNKQLKMQKVRNSIPECIIHANVCFKEKMWEKWEFLECAKLVPQMFRILFSFHTTWVRPL